MTEQERITFKNFIESNSAFCCAINNDNIPEFDFYTTFELILIYLKTNIHILKKLGLSDIIELITKNDYIIEENNIIHKSKTYTVNDFKNIVYAIQHELDLIEQSKLIPFPNTKIENDESTPKGETIKIKIPEIPTKQRGLIFESHATINNDTLPYIKGTQFTFNERIFYCLDCIFSNRKIEFEFDGDYKLIASMLNLYPLTEYIPEESTPYLDFELPQNTIGLRTALYEDKEVESIEEKIKRYSREQERLERIICCLRSVTSTERIDALNGMVEEYRRKEFKAMFDKYTATHKTLIFNKTLIDYIRKAIAKGYVDVNYHYLNPLVRIFYIEDNKVVFICTMHLDTFYGIVDNQKYQKEKAYTLEYKPE